MDQPSFFDIEKTPGAPDVAAIDSSQVDQRRKKAFTSFEMFLRRKISELSAQRDDLWCRDYTSIDAYERSVEPWRARLKAMLGFWLEPQDRPALNIHEGELLYDESDFAARLFQIELCDGCETYGIELTPKTKGPRPGLVIQHGYCGSPELICGFVPSANSEDYSHRSLGLRAVKRGYHVVAVHHPYGYGVARDECGTIPGHEEFGVTYGKNRLHKLATLCGATSFGLDMLATSRGIDLLISHSSVDADRIGLYGLSRGGQTALYLPALDKRIKAAVASAYFNERLSKLIGPQRGNYLDAWPGYEQFFRDSIRYFSDSDIVALIVPRAFAVEAGVRDTSVEFESAFREFQRAKVHYESLNIAEKIMFIAHREGHVSATAEAFDFLAQNL